MKTNYDPATIVLQYRYNESSTNEPQKALFTSFKFIPTKIWIILVLIIFFTNKKVLFWFLNIHSADTGNLLAMFHSLLSESDSQDREGERNDSLDQGGTVLSVSLSSTETFPCRHLNQSVYLSSLV